MSITRRKLLQRAALVAATLPLISILKQDKSSLESETIDMYRYPNNDSPIGGWLCKRCQKSNNLYNRHCWHCGETEEGIPVRWTCPDCNETVPWGQYCHCYHHAHSVKDNKINPFWIG